MPDPDPDPDAPPPPACAFCDKTADQVRLLVAGHTAHICDECVVLAQAAVGAPAAAGGDEARDHLRAAWADFVVGKRWTLAMMTGVLVRLADGGGAPADVRADGFEMIAFALNQAHRPPPPPRDAADIRTCDYCAKRGDELKAVSVGHGGSICGDCLDLLQESRAMVDAAYRAELIARLTALTDDF